MSGAGSTGAPVLLRDPAIDRLEQATFEGLGCREHGLVVLQGAESWGAHERGHIDLPTRGGLLSLPLAYDEREAPYAVNDAGEEVCDLLLSLTDEDDVIACAWARVAPCSPLRGVGVDLSDASHFRRHVTPRGRDLSLLLFTEGERALLDKLGCTDDALAKAALFASKEAAFKATAAPLRRWYDTHDQELRYEVRHFVMEEPGLERGTGRNAAAQDALDLMGIARIAVRHAEVGNRSLVTAVALAN